VAICGLSYVDSFIYFRDLNAYFDYIEKSYDVKVVIAAHPKAYSYKDINPFNGREIVFNKSCELIKDSQFVLTHHSTAISFAILFRKPIVFLNSFEIRLKMPDLWNLTVFWASIFNSDLVDFDDTTSYGSLKFNVDTRAYNEYKYMYLTSKTSETRYSEDIYLETIKGI
jgi:hypothetical protein